MGNNNLLSFTAADARITANTTTKALGRIYKAIIEEAEDGRTVLYWDITNFSQVLVITIKESLKKNGYNVFYDNEEMCLKISW